MVLGGWNYEDVKSCKLPQKAQSAFTAVTSELTGADYMPVAYMGSQIAHGVNYRIIALQTLVIPNAEPRPVRIIINIAPDDTVSLVSIKGITL